jgi:hypothetical protein
MLGEIYKKNHTTIMWHVMTLVEHRVETAAGHMVGGESVYILSLT